MKINAANSPDWKRPRRYSLALRLRFLRVLFGPNCKFSLTRRLILLSRRYTVSQRQAWRWVALYRKAGADGLRDHLRSDTLTRRSPGVLSIDTGASAYLPIDAAKPRHDEGLKS